MMIYSHQSPWKPKSLNRSRNSSNYWIWMSTEMRNPANRPYPKPFGSNLRQIYWTSNNW